MVREMRTDSRKAGRNEVLMELRCVSQRVTTAIEMLLHSDLKLARLKHVSPEGSKASLQEAEPDLASKQVHADDFGVGLMSRTRLDPMSRGKKNATIIGTQMFVPRKSLQGITEKLRSRSQCVWSSRLRFFVQSKRFSSLIAQCVGSLRAHILHFW